MDRMLLAGDIGGTKTLLGVYSADAGPRRPLAQAEFATADYTGLSTMVKDFVAGQTFPIGAACFAVAGPVISRRATVTNLSWVIDRTELSRDLGIAHVDLINDVEAIAIAVPALRDDDVVMLNAGEPVLGGAIAILAAGTGLGEAFLTWDGARYIPHPSEGGHADFAPADAEQARLLDHLRQRFGHVSVERVCSGIGIPNIYTFLRDSGPLVESPALSEQLLATADRARVILDAAVRAPADALCAATVERFVAILGAEAANLALKVLATGGVYVAGGIPSVVLTFLTDPAFLEAFRRKGRLADVLTRMPISVVVCRSAALIGAATRGLESMALPPLPE